MLVVRIIGVADIEAICRHRRLMFLESGRPAADVEAMTAPFRAWLAPRIADGRYFGFVAEEDGAIAGGVGLLEVEWPPHPMHPLDARRGYVCNVYVEAERRRRGIARDLMTAAEAELRRRGLRYATLHATAEGRELYASEGWASTTEMSKALGG